ncbi:MAG: hypothetical protein R3F53_20670 [Gammaproteobacteria bacterium]
MPLVPEWEKLLENVDREDEAALANYSHTNLQQAGTGLRYPLILFAELEHTGCTMAAG